MKRTHKILLSCLVTALVVCSAAAADPPDRVGRLNFIAGGVSFRPSDTYGWTSATLNYPLTAGDSLWTDDASRAEVHVGSTAVRLGPAGELSFQELDDRRVRISLPRGLLNVRLRELDPGESFQIDTPTMSVLILGPGSYRVEVREWGDTQATVNEGAMQALVGGQSYAIRARQSAFVAQSDWLSLELGRAPAADEWDRWCAGRDSREDRLASIRYVPRSMVGCEDLDWYGNWNETPEYGPVWIPSSLPVGWAPYKFGRWTWVQPWGWTWIDDMPWGFAPFHYGRWAQFRGVWVWVPGSILHRPVYAPALVLFAGTGPKGPVRNGKFEWFPLGPREVYVPPYQASRAYIQKVNLQHVRIGDNETIEAIKVRQVNRDADRDPPQVFAQALRQLFTQALENGDRAASRPREAEGTEQRKAAVRNEPAAERRQAEVKQAPKEQKELKLQKVRKKKKLPNGQWAWVEEWVEE
jgi:hypothetical protein